MRKQAIGSTNGPTASHNNTTTSDAKCLPSCDRCFEDVLGLVEDYLKLDCTYCIAMAYPPHPGRFCIVSLMVDGTTQGKEYTLDCVGNKMLLDLNTLGDILANLTYGGCEAVDMYISSRCGVGRVLSRSKPKEVLVVVRPLLYT